MQLQKYYIGIDVSKETLDIALTEEGQFVSGVSIGNNTKEIKKIFSDWEKEFGLDLGQTLVCMEHTGIYCWPLLVFLQQTPCKVCLENAYRIKHSNGLQRGKNDRVDAERIALYAWRNKDFLQEWKAPKSNIKRLKQLMTMRKGLVNAKKKLLVPIKETGKFIDRYMAKELEKSCCRSIRALERDIMAIEERILGIVRSDNNLGRMFDILVSIDGIGKITAIMFLTTTNAFTSFKEAKKYACYAGVVPFEHSSGKSIRGKTKLSHFANKDMKTVLHLCALTLCNSKGELGVYYRRKVAEGKNKMSVLNALRNKIVLRAFACIKEDKLYEKNYQNKFA